MGSCVCIRYGLHGRQDLVQHLLQHCIKAPVIHSMAPKPCPEVRTSWVTCICGFTNHPCHAIAFRPSNTLYLAGWSHLLYSWSIQNLRIERWCSATMLLGRDQARPEKYPDTHSRIYFYERSTTLVPKILPRSSSGDPPVALFPFFYSFNRSDYVHLPIIPRQCCAFLEGYCRVTNIQQSRLSAPTDQLLSFCVVFISIFKISSFDRRTQWHLH